MNIPLSPHVPENLVSRDGLSRPVPRQPALHPQAESGAYSRDSSRFPRRRPSFYLNRHTPLGQCRLYGVTQFRTSDVHCRESASTGPVVLKVVPVTGAAILQVTMDQLICASLFHTHYRYKVGTLKVPAVRRPRNLQTKKVKQSKKYNTTSSHKRILVRGVRARFIYQNSIKTCFSLQRLRSKDHALL